MSNYMDGADFPFAAFITNLGKYNEGELVGEWVKFPTTAEKLKEVFQRIGIGQEDDFGQPYEEWFITDYDCYVDGLYGRLEEYENLDELNYLASKLDEMDQSDLARFQAALDACDFANLLEGLIDLTGNLDCYDIYPEIEDCDDLGRYYIEELVGLEVPEYLKEYIDYEGYGESIALDENGQFTEQGYVRYNGTSFHEVYNGDPETIPEEYRVIPTQTERKPSVREALEQFKEEQKPARTAKPPQEMER